MLVFERTDDHTTLKIEGSLNDITGELLLCIGLVHNAVKGKSPDAAKELRRSLELFMKHGEKPNEMLFEHFDDNDFMKKELERVKEENKKKLQKSMMDFFTELQNMAKRNPIIVDRDEDDG